VPPRSSIPPSIRRAAARPAGPRGRRPPRRLLDAAAAGVLTRGNTRKGTRGRQAVDRIVFLRRRAAAPDLSAREALGHRVAGSRDRMATFFADDPPRGVTVAGPDVTIRDVRRAASYLGMVGGLVEAHRRGPDDWSVVAARFRARWRRARPIAGLRPLADPEAVLALATELQADDWRPIFDSGRSKPRRRSGSGTA